MSRTTGKFRFPMSCVVYGSLDLIF